MKVLRYLFIAALLGIALTGLVIPSAGAATLEDVEKSFYPYKDGPPTFPGLEVGMTINKTNVDKFKEILDPEYFKYIKAGWLNMKVGETTSMPTHQNYITSTKDNLNKVTLGAEIGQINGYITGRAFPEEPDINDPRAGEKLAWNYKYGSMLGDNAAAYPTYWYFRDFKKDKVERTLKFGFHFIMIKHRVQYPPMPEILPNKNEIYRGTYAQVHEPFDVKNTQLLIHRASDDQKRDSAWLYLGFQRRVRRLATGQITDAFLGSDIMIEDFEGYNGRVSDMQWKYTGAVNLMMPIYRHNELPQMGLPLNPEKDEEGYQHVSFGGKSNCFPNITYSLRKIYQVEQTPVDSNHPIGKRVVFFDAQSFKVARTNMYDRSGKLWKTFLVGLTHPDYHLPINKGSGVFFDDSFCMIDVQAQHATVGTFKFKADPALSPIEKFTVQNMRSTGR
jgi:uncharacterized protein DUF1329